MRIVLATNNAGKLREFAELLQHLNVELLPVGAFSAAVPEETGLSFIENAILKARHASQVSGLPAIADDSGLEVDALRGAPGIYSARYAGAGASDQQNLQLLLENLRGVDTASRTARYQCALAYMRHAADPSPIVCQAAWEGLMRTEPVGHEGFGYDPIFEVADLGISAAQLRATEKNRLSHRGRAIQLLFHQLRAEVAS
jgi:XTP/dITP diphosphohydrolase